MTGDARTPAAMVSMSEASTRGSRGSSTDPPPRREGTAARPRSWRALAQRWPRGSARPSGVTRLCAGPRQRHRTAPRGLATASGKPAPTRCSACRTGNPRVPGSARPLRSPPAPEPAAAPRGRALHRTHDHPRPGTSPTAGRCASPVADDVRRALLAPGSRSRRGAAACGREAEDATRPPPPPRIVVPSRAQPARNHAECHDLPRFSGGRRARSPRAVVSPSRARRPAHPHRPWRDRSGSNRSGPRRARTPVRQRHARRPPAPVPEQRSTAEEGGEPHGRLRGATNPRPRTGASRRSREERQGRNVRDAGCGAPRAVWASAPPPGEDRPKACRRRGTVATPREELAAVSTRGGAFAQGGDARHAGPLASRTSGHVSEREAKSTEGRHQDRVRSRAPAPEAPRGPGRRNRVVAKVEEVGSEGQRAATGTAYPLPSQDPPTLGGRASAPPGRSATL